MRRVYKNENPTTATPKQKNGQMKPQLIPDQSFHSFSSSKSASPRSELHNICRWTDLPVPNLRDALRGARYYYFIRRLSALAWQWHNFTLISSHNLLSSLWGPKTRKSPSRSTYYWIFKLEQIQSLVRTLVFFISSRLEKKGAWLNILQMFSPRNSNHFYAVQKRNGI